MKKLIGVASVFIAVNASAIDVQHWRCKAERTVGVDVSNDLRPANFTNRNEYRILPVESVLEKVGERLHEVINESIERQRVIDEADEFAFTDGYALMRTVSSDPKNPFSWNVCSVNEYRARLEDAEYGNYTILKHPAYQTFTCEYDRFDFVTLSKRFTRNTQGNWRYGGKDGMHLTEKGVEADNDYSFEFGTCEPYYD
ncbi:hypothetical protein N8723_03840 [Luminiphilus sp.]|nr:hypothetical protein [Luminiphilus sp.]